MRLVEEGRISLVIFLPLLAQSLLTAAQAPAIPSKTIPELTPASVFRVDASLALVQFQVIPRSGQPPGMLQPEDIEILEDNVPQKTSLLENARLQSSVGVPVEITVLFDCSGSMTHSGALNPNVFQENILDEYESAFISIYAFSNKWKRLARPTRDMATLKKALGEAVAMPSLRTPLFGTIAEVARDAARGRADAVHKMVIFSDGVSDTNGMKDLRRSGEAVEAARKYGIEVYPVVLERAVVCAFDACASIRRFGELGEATGGQSFKQKTTAGALPEVLKTLARQVLQYTYIAGYYPTSSGEKKSHEVRVVLRDRNKGDLVAGSRTVTH